MQLFDKGQKTPLEEHLKAALTADSSFQSNQRQLQGVAMTAGKNYFYLAKITALA